MTKMGKKLVERFASKIAPSGDFQNSRPDLYLADWKRVSSHSAKLLVGWAASLEAPTPEAIDNFVLASFDGKIQLNIATLRVHPTSQAASFVVSSVVPTRHLKDASSLLKVGPTRYMERKANGEQDVWEVREDGDGNRHLVMLAEDNLDEVLEERKRAIQFRGQGRVASFDRLSTPGRPVVNDGDRVKFYHKGLLKEGTVLRREEGDFVIRSGSTRCRVTEAAVIDVVTKDPATVMNQKERVRLYWERILGKEYVDKWLGVSRQGATRQAVSGTKEFRFTVRPMHKEMLETECEKRGIQCRMRLNKALKDMYILEVYNKKDADQVRSLMKGLGSYYFGK
jgi:hypothetical protein